MPMGIISKVGKSKAVPKEVKSYVQKAIDANTENKYKVFSLVTQHGSIASTWGETVLTTVAQGIAKEQRIGNKIRVKSLEIKGVICQGSNELLSDDAFNVVRMVVGTYSGTTLTPLATAARGMNDPIRKDYLSANGLLRKKYVDKYIPLMVTGTEQGAGDGYTPQLKTVKYYKQWKKGITIQFSNDTTNYPNTNLVVSFLSDSVAVTHPGFIAGYMVMTFEDA